jgi:hypothetical protein
LTRFKWSIRLFKQNLAYRLGIGSEWEEKTVNPANGFIKGQFWITFTIIVLALSGSMKDEIVLQSEVAWHVGLVNIMSSDLQTIMTWVSGLLFTITAVFSAQLVTRYIAVQALEAEKDMHKISKRISDKEQGIVKVPLSQLMGKRKTLEGLTNVSENDIVQLKPVMKFYDGVERSFSKAYGSEQGLINFIKRSVEKREVVNG